MTEAAARDDASESRCGDHAHGDGVCSDDPFAADRDVALDAVSTAAAAVMQRFGRDQDVEYKGPDQPVTAADLEADRTLRRALRAARPDYGWLSEETVDRPDRLARERVWIVDPIDGTRSYIADRPEFAISIGLAQAGAAVLGVVCNPARAEVFWATRGGGAHRATLRSGGRPRDVRPLSVTDRSRAERTVLLASRSEIAAGEFEPFEHGALADALGGWRFEPTGSTAYKLACIAAGMGDVYLSRGPKSEWDVCAGALLVEEAGGRATDLHGRRLRYNRRDPYVHGVLASNGRMHDDVLEIVATLPPSGRLREEEE